MTFAVDLFNYSQKCHCVHDSEMGFVSYVALSILTGHTLPVQCYANDT